MSEIERYDCEEDRSCEYEVKTVMQVDPTGYYVRHADHLVYLNEMRMDRDAQRLRADTAEAELKEAMETLEFNTNCWARERAVMIDKNQTLTADLLACGLRRKAAEQRIAELVALLQRVVDCSVLSFEADAPEDLESLEVDICAALNPNPEAEIHDRLDDEALQRRHDDERREYFSEDQ